MNRIYVRNDLRQIHIVVGDSVVKIDDKALAMNDPDILLVPEDKQLLQRLARKIVI